MGQILTRDNIPLLVRASGTAIVLASTYLGKTTRITIGGQQYPLVNSLALNTGTVGIGGLDTGSLVANTLYYVYAVLSGSTVGLIASLAAPTTGPAGYTSAFKFLGRFRTDFAAATIATYSVATDSSIQPHGSSAEGPFSYSPSEITGLVSGAEVLGTPVITWSRETASALVTATFLTDTVTGTAARFGLPPGMTIATVQSSGLVCGTWQRNNATGAQRKEGLMLANSGLTYVSFTSGDYTTAVSPFTALAGSTLFNNDQVVTLRFTVPIAEWVGLFS